MEKKEQRLTQNYIYDEQGTNEVSAQIVSAYNSGVIDQPDGQFDLTAHSYPDEE